MGIGRFAFTPLLPMMQESAGLSLAAGGWLASANYLGYLLGALGAMRFGLRSATAIRGGLLGIGVVTLAMGLTQDFALWIALRLAAGIASAWVLVSVSAQVVERLGVVYAGVGTGSAVAGLLCLLLMAMHASSSAAWISLGAVALVVAAALWNAFPSTSSPERDAAPADAWSLEHWRLLLCYGAYGFAYIIPATFLPAMARALVSDPLVFGLAWPVFGAAAALSCLGVGALRDRVPDRAIWIACHWVMAFGVAIPVAVPNLAGIIAAALAVGGTFVVITQVGLQEARRVAGADARRLMAGMTAAFALGQMVGPLPVGLLPGPAPALLFAAVLLVASAIFLRFPRPPRGCSSVQDA
jgi:predicted MFS family arabinose efflux permease